MLHTLPPTADLSVMDDFAPERVGALVRRDALPPLPLPLNVLRRPIGSVSVCVPAKNEMARLPQFFASLRTAVLAAMGAGVSCEVVMALDGCTDGSQGFVEAQHLSFPCPVRHVLLKELGHPHAGRARRAAMDAALRGRGFDASHAILTTDADSLVDREWIVATARALRHTDLVAGYVEWDDETPIAALTEQESYFDRLHRWRRRIDPVAHDAADPHHKSYGASLAIRQDAYRRVGGLPELPSSEDVALCRAVRLAGLRMRQDRAVRVLTSTRRRGRATGGFSDAIVTVDAMLERGEGLRVPCPDALTAQYRRAARLRAGYRALAEAGNGGTSVVANDLDWSGRASGYAEFGRTSFGLGVHEIALACEARSADAFVTRVMEPESGADVADVPPSVPLSVPPLVPLHAAIRRLDALGYEDREIEGKGETR